MTNQRKLNKIKYSAFKLKEGGQIPPSLFTLICQCSLDLGEDYIRDLMNLTEHLMRIKGYYFRFSEIELGVDKTIKEFLETRKGKKV